MASTIVACSAGTATLTCGRASAAISPPWPGAASSSGAWRRQPGRRGTTDGAWPAPRTRPRCGAGGAPWRRRRRRAAAGAAARAAGAGAWKLIGDRVAMSATAGIARRCSAWSAGVGPVTAPAPAGRRARRRASASRRRGGPRRRRDSPGRRSWTAAATSSGSATALAVDRDDDVARAHPALAAGPARRDLLRPRRRRCLAPVETPR